jgi:hypothetical protein
MLALHYAALPQGPHRSGVVPGTQNEWRGIGVQQSRGWVHYAIHRPEPHIMLFRCVKRRLLSCFRPHALI